MQYKELVWVDFNDFPRFSAISPEVYQFFFSEVYKHFIFPEVYQFFIFPEVHQICIFPEVYQNFPFPKKRLKKEKGGDS